MLKDVLFVPFLNGLGNLASKKTGKGEDTAFNKLRSL